MFPRGSFGPRFPGMSNAYDKKLRQEAKCVVKEMGIEDSVHEGVYVMIGGPSYETVAELRMLNLMGADAVGKELKSTEVEGLRGVCSEAHT